jgi:hypothetical protein
MSSAYGGRRLPAIKQVHTRAGCKAHLAKGSTIENGKRFFFEKKNEKAFAPEALRGQTRTPNRQSLCVVFQTEALPRLQMM